MNTIYEAVVEVIEHRFSDEPDTYNDAIVFYLQAARSCYEIEILLKEFVDKQGKSAHAVKISVAYCDTEGECFTFPVPFVDLLMLCNDLKSGFSWGAFEVEAFDEDLYITNYRWIEVTDEDLAAALREGEHSVFIETIDRLLQESEEISPVFIALAQGMELTPDNIEFLAQADAGHA